MTSSPDHPNSTESVIITLDSALVAEAKQLGIDFSSTAELGLVDAVSAEKSRRWKFENEPAIDQWNQWVTVKGLPLAKYRQF